MQKTLPLAIRLGNWRLFSQRREDKRFESVAKKVFERDSHTCHFCDFQAFRHQEVINLNHNYRDNKLDNLATACCFCTQTQFIEAVGSGYGGGRLIYLPEMSQTELNSFCHVTFCAMMNATDYRDSAQTIYRDLKFRSRLIDEKFGEGGSKPAVFAQMLIEQAEDVLESSLKLMKDMRLLPAYPKFKPLLEAWAQDAADELEQQQQQ